VAERPKPAPYGTGEQKDDPKNVESKPGQQPGSQSQPSQSKQTPYRTS
jgi:hypothetical protein